jgi:hypothetical protein
LRGGDGDLAEEWIGSLRAAGFFGTPNSTPVTTGVPIATSILKTKEKVLKTQELYCGRCSTGNSNRMKMDSNIACTFWTVPLEELYDALAWKVFVTRQLDISSRLML